MTGNVAPVVPGATFGGFSTVYHGQVQGGTNATNAEYVYGLDTAGIAEALSSTNAIDIGSTLSTDQLQGGFEAGTIGYPSTFDIANFNIGQLQGVTNVGMAAATNIIGNVDVGQMPSEVDAGLDASFVDMEWADEFAAGISADWPAEWTAEWIDE
jgi:hypothetical protein